MQVGELKGKKPTTKTRKHLIKYILVLLSFLVVLQNVLMVFEMLRFEVAVSLVQTLLVGAYTYSMNTRLNADK